jgi:hypothetical protein
MSMTRVIHGKPKRKSDQTKPKQEPLTLVEAEREFGRVARAFAAYIEKHLGQTSILLAELGEKA